jgi:hypothetical protein
MNPLQISTEFLSTALSSLCISGGVSFGEPSGTKYATELVIVSPLSPNLAPLLKPGEIIKYGLDEEVRGWEEIAAESRAKWAAENEP